MRATGANFQSTYSSSCERCRSSWTDATPSRTKSRTRVSLSGRCDVCRLLLSLLALQALLGRGGLRLRGVTERRPRERFILAPCRSPTCRRTVEGKSRRHAQGRRLGGGHHRRKRHERQRRTRPSECGPAHRNNNNNITGMCVRGGGSPPELPLHGFESQVLNHQRETGTKPLKRFALCHKVRSRSLFFFPFFLF